MYDVLAIFVTLPMLLSVASYAWGRAFGDPDPFPGGAGLHVLLILLQILTVTLVYSFPSLISFLGISLLYFIQGLGVACFIRIKGRVDCGCFGPQISSRLGFPLIGFNLAMGFAGLVCSSSARLAFQQSFTVTGLLMEGMILLVALFVVVGVPDALHAIRIYREIAAPHILKIKRR